MKVVITIAEDDEVRAVEFIQVVHRDGGFVYLDKDGTRQVMISADSVALEIP